MKAKMDLALLLVPLAFLALPALLPLLMATPRRLLICDAMLGAAILAHWNWAAVQVARGAGAGAAAQAAATAAAYLPMVAIAALAAGSLARAAMFHFSATKPWTAETPRPGFDKAWLLLLLIPLAFAPRILGGLPATAP